MAVERRAVPLGGATLSPVYDVVKLIFTTLYISLDRMRVAL